MQWVKNLFGEHCDQFGRLSISDFSQMIQPSQKEYQLLLSCRKGNVHISDIRNVSLRTVRFNICLPQFLKEISN